MIADRINQSIAIINLSQDEAFDRRYNISLNAFESGRMLLVAMIKQSVDDIVNFKTNKSSEVKRNAADATRWLESDESTAIIHAAGIKLTGKNILSMAIKKKDLKTNSKRKRRKK